MKKYFLNDGTAQQGPFDIEELRSKNITAETPVWYDGLPEWTTAGKLEELKVLFSAVPPPFTTVVPAPVEEIKPVTHVSAEPVVTTSSTTVTAAAKPAKPATTAKKNTKGISWALTLLVLGGVGYFIYQDMEKNKSASAHAGKTEANAGTTAPARLSTTDSSTAETNAADTLTTPVTEPAITVTTKPVTTEQTAAQKAAATKKAAEEKKKLLAIEAQKKAEADKKKQEAALAAAAAREKEMRNHWTKYISLGTLNYDMKGDGIKAFDVPIYNSTDAALDKVTIRVEYTKKNDKKIVKTETITIYNIPPKGSLNGKAPESKKGDKVNVFITGINSRKLHFCYPQNNGDPGDPYYCN